MAHTLPRLSDDKIQVAFRSALLLGVLCYRDNLPFIRRKRVERNLMKNILTGAVSAGMVIHTTSYVVCMTSLLNFIKYGRV
jgi:hypothetical protein